MSLVAAPIASTPAPAVPDIVAGDGWYPDVSIAAFRVAQRMPQAVTDARCREALLTALIWVADELSTWRARQGAASIADVPGRGFGGEAMVLTRWRTATYAKAASLLAETHNDIGVSEPGRTRTDTGRAHTDATAAGAVALQAVATVAIRGILGVRPSRVRLVGPPCRHQP